MYEAIMLTLFAIITVISILIGINGEASDGWKGWISGTVVLLGIHIIKIIWQTF